MKDKGFTLIEVIICIAIVVVLIAIVLSPPSGTTTTKPKPSSENSQPTSLNVDGVFCIEGLQYYSVAGGITPVYINTEMGIRIKTCEVKHET